MTDRSLCQNELVDDTLTYSIQFNFFFPFQKPLNPNNMSNFSIFPPISMLLFYSHIFLLLFLFPQQLSAPNSAWNCPNTAPIQFRTVPPQVSQKLSPPTKIFLPFYNCQKINNKILHRRIILFSNNSFAIIGIPYFKMFSPSNSRKRKALLRITSNQSDQKLQKLLPAPLANKVAMSTK